MYELHENEQYFFDEPTLKRFSLFLKSGYENIYICCLCIPLLGKRLLEECCMNVDILDIDERFSDLKTQRICEPNFILYDLKHPRFLPRTQYGLIICDPPFFSVSLSQLFKSIYELSHYNFNQKIMISYLKRREMALLGTFDKFNLKPTGFYPTYQTVDTTDRNKIEFYSNIEDFDKQPWASLLLLK